jgi:hypothetical protein
MPDVDKATRGDKSVTPVRSALVTEDNSLITPGRKIQPEAAENATTIAPLVCAYRDSS